MKVGVKQSLPPHGGQLHRIADHFGVSQTELLDFSANLSPYGPPASVISALQKAVCSPAILKEYPDADYSALRERYAAHYRVSVGSLAVANGVIPLLDAALRAMQVKRCVLPVPSFLEYRKVLEQCAVNIFPYVLSPEENFLIETDSLKNFALRNSCDCVLLANPQNPSGVALPRVVLKQLMEELLAVKIQVLLDEAFIDYLPGESLASLAAEREGFVLFRSVTKFFSLAGMRVGFAVGSQDLRSKVQGIIPEWPVTTLAALAAERALDDEQYIETALHSNTRERKEVAYQLQEIGLTVYPGQANFLLIELPQAIEGRDFWEKLIQEHGIVTRRCDNFESLGSGYIRVAIRRREENNRLVTAVRQVLTA